MSAKRQKIEELMKSLNVSVFPEYFREIYDEVIDDYEKNGCIYLSETFIDETDEKYGILKSFKEGYKEAAREISKDDQLCRYLALLCRAMKNRERFNAEFSSLELVRSQNGEYHIKYEMLPAIAALSMADHTHSLLCEMGAPKRVFDYIMSGFEGRISAFAQRNNGKLGLWSFSWQQRLIDVKLFPVERLVMETDAKFNPHAEVFENKNGTTVALAKALAVHRSGYILGCAGYEDENEAFYADIDEDEISFTGHAFTRYGKIEKEKSVLKKSEWKKIISAGAPVVSVHIPAGGNLSPELVERSFREAKEYLEKCSPMTDYKAFVCGSWLMDEQLIDLLGEDKNISKFCSRFKKIGRKNKGRAVFSFVYLVSDANNVDYANLPEKTTLERLIKKHYLEGNIIHENYGYIPKNKI